MKNKISKYKILIAAGGTGGHLFPAIAIAEEIKSLILDADILFVGTKKRMEKEIIPKLGFKFSGTSIIGLPRKVGFRLIGFIFSLIIAFFEALVSVLKFKPKVALGTGSYISVPPLLASKVFGAKIFLVESNSFPGVATKFLAPIANEIYLSFEQSKKYFKDTSKLVVTGTPVRKKLFERDRKKAAEYFNLSENLKTIVVIGGSLGARSINEKIKEIYPELSRNYQLIWQTGKKDFDIYKNLEKNERVVITPFVDRMDYAYSICDLLISRSGASTISEIIAQGIPAILIPSPNVTENHQYYNALELVESNAAELHLDNESSESLLKKILFLMENETRLQEISNNAKGLFKIDASKVIAERILKYLNEK
ncbi:MAG: undecaprenyldiphospho-muramoylpentapeptide beta-N-acetylglucosaminyltransferase [Ignavibacteria bacterium]|jgi:UDP-N-acetylglucosamine--N-acetylmuramyl-(pentapeptide) pyrophosphoryl-undecaprenol N-acetylglucosamine transferase|nr:undecaprenyldiphospho-muramoylpentapeptide beta-N-acetylglucosaminyltransferase [Ignavibacteria bacterium]MDH7527379.1 undecaprenyldiphospho-muramoylpentapeptide beta-N-acetylglucosaminyltransferase [Ignavibacteria bacterium]